MRPISRRAILAVLALAASTVPARAAQLQISVKNDQPNGGFAFTPVWFGVHDGTFDDFNAGDTASTQVTNLAELGDASGLSSLLMGHGQSTTVMSSGMIAPFTPGATGSAILNVTNPGVDQYLSFGAMVVPSNDLFLGNDNPTGYHLFDASGKFLGPITITLYGSDVWDAQTEVDNIKDGAAFIQGEDAHGGMQISDGHITAFLSESNATSYLNSISGQETSASYAITHLFSANDRIATITISTVPEPGAVVLLAIGASGAGLWLAHARRSPQTANGVTPADL